MALEKARAASIPASMVVVGDDVGVGRTQSGKVGRRGIAGTCLVHKIAGAAASSASLDLGLDEVVRIAETVAQNLVSVGASLAHVHVPGRAVQGGGEWEVENALRDGEIEVGMGIHNEDGCERVRLELPALVDKMLRQLLDRGDEDRHFIDIDGGDEVVLLVNNLGGVSPLEMAGIANEVIQQLNVTYGIRPIRILVGTFMTSLNGLGFSVTLLKVVELGVGLGMLELLDAPTEAVGWAANVTSKTWCAKQEKEEPETQAGEGHGQQQIKPSNITCKCNIALVNTE